MGRVLQAGDESKRSLGGGGAVGPELGKNCVRVGVGFGGGSILFKPKR
jgi:hypothetical protein